MMLKLLTKARPAAAWWPYQAWELFTALTFMSTIDDPDRFHRSRDVSAHLGLTPKKYPWGEADRNCNISKCGDAAMRAVLYQSALSLLQRVLPSGFADSALRSVAAFAERPSQSHANLRYSCTPLFGPMARISLA